MIYVFNLRRRVKPTDDPIPESERHVALFCEARNAFEFWSNFPNPDDLFCVVTRYDTYTCYDTLSDFERALDFFPGPYSYLFDD